MSQVTGVCQLLIPNTEGYNSSVSLHRKEIDPTRDNVKTTTKSHKNLITVPSLTLTSFEVSRVSPTEGNEYELEDFL